MQAYEAPFNIACAGYFTIKNSDGYLRYFREEDFDFYHKVWQGLFDRRGGIFPASLFDKLTMLVRTQAGR
jgi:hypothetical protein